MCDTCCVWGPKAAHGNRLWSSVWTRTTHISVHVCRARVCGARLWCTYLSFTCVSCTRLWCICVSCTCLWCTCLSYTRLWCTCLSWKGVWCTRLSCTCLSCTSVVHACGAADAPAYLIIPTEDWRHGPNNSHTKKKQPRQTPAPPHSGWWTNVILASIPEVELVVLCAIAVLYKKCTDLSVKQQAFDSGLLYGLQVTVTREGGCSWFTLKSARRNNLVKIFIIK